MLKVVEIKDGVVKVAGKHPFCMLESFVISAKDKSSYATLFEAGADFCKMFLHDSDFPVAPGMVVKPLNSTLFADLYEDLQGAVIDPFGNHLEGRPPHKKAERVQVVVPPTALMDRTATVKPLLTGTLALDWIIPIGKGQRQLVIGDSGVGKTQLCLNTICAQKNQSVRCVYVAIGQKNSEITSCHEKLKHAGAMAYTTIVAASASANALSRYAAPLTGMRLAELWASKGLDVLVVFDDLSKHAESYRELSLLLERPPGRESYPGDVFTQHASLLERSGAFEKRVGGGSITAIPVASTLDGELAAFIPTNLISITDGQVSMSKDLFMQGVRPAIDLGLSVSRIGSKAQQPNIRQMTATLKVDISVYNEQKSFLRLSKEAALPYRSKLSKIAVLPELMVQSVDEIVSPAASVLLLGVYRSGLLGGVNNTAKAIMAIKKVIADPWFSSLLKGKDPAQLAGAEIDAVVEAVLAPFLKSFSQVYGGTASAFEHIPTDHRLYERMFKQDRGLV